MEDEEKIKRLETGRDLLAAHIRKKQSSSSKHPKKRREMGDYGDISTGSDEVINQNSHVSSKSTISSLDSDTIAEYNNVMSELDDVLAIRDEQLQATKQEVFANCGGSLSIGDVILLSQHNSTVQEFQNALAKRDVMIEQLTVSLNDNVMQKDKYFKDVEQLNLTVAELQNQIKQTNSLLNLDASPTKQLLQAQQHLKEFELCVQEQITVIQKLKSEAAEKNTEIAQSKQDLSSQKSKSAVEVQQLMFEVQRLHQEVSTLAAEREDLVLKHNKDVEDQRAQLEEHFGLQLGQITEEWRQIQSQQQEQLDKQHKHEIELIRATHGEEIAKLRQALLDHGTSNEQTTKLQLEVEQLTSALREQQSNWSEDKTSLNSELESLRVQFSQLEAEKHQLDELTNEKDKSLCELSSKLNSLAAERENMTISFNQQINELQQLNNKNENIILELRNKYSELEIENNNLNEKIKLVDMERENLNQELSKVRSIQSKCDLIQAEYMGVLSEKKDAENEISHLYSQVKALKKQVASKKTQQKETEKAMEDIACVEFENEVDAAEKGVFSPKRIKLDVPTSPASIILWIEKCESLEKELRTAQANVLRLQTQLQNEQLQSKLLSEEKTSSTQKIKELQEKNSSLQKTAGSLSRSKKLMNQYEMKIASLENEKSNLSKSLEQLGDELKKSQTNYEEKLSSLQEQLCNSLNVKTNNIEELIIESCSKAKELVVLKETLRSHSENENTLQNKITLLDKLISEHEGSFKASQEELQNAQEQLAECWDVISKKEELIGAREREIAILSLQREQLERQTKALCQSSQMSGVQKELLSLVEELATEMFELKLSLTAEKSKNESLSREVSPFKTEKILNHEKLLHKLQEQQMIIENMKAERSVGEWATKLEIQLAEMIEDLTAYMSQQACLAATQRATSALQQDLLVQRQDMEQRLQDKSTLEIQLQQEQNNLRGAKLQIKLLETQLADKEQQYQELLQQQEIVEQELLILESSLESKEQLLQDQRLRLEMEVRNRELQIKQCQAEARCREVELLLPHAPPPQVTSHADPEVTTVSTKKLEEMREALDAVHAAAVAKLRLHLSEQFDLNVSEVRQQYAEQHAEMQQKHAEQVCELTKKLTEKEQAHRSQSHLDILVQLGLPSGVDTAQAKLHLQDKLKQDLVLLRQSLSQKESSVYGMLESKFQQLAQQQVLLAIAKLREESEASFTRELASLNLAHSETLKSLQATLNHDMEKQVHRVKEELLAQHTEGISEGKTAEAKLQFLLKNDKDQANQAILNQIELSTKTQFTQTLQDMCNSWVEKCKKELQAILTQVTESCDLEDSTERVERLASLQQRLVLCAREVRCNLCEQHAVEVDTLMSSVQAKHKDLQNCVSEAQELDNLYHQVQLLTSERDGLLEKLSELEHYQSVVAEFEESSAGVADLLKLKEEDHKKEMDELRTYFQQKCSDMEKQYTEKVLSQHSRNSSSSCSENELNSSEMLCADGDHANRLASITRICDTFSDIPSFNDVEDQYKELERRCLQCKSEMENIKDTFESKYETDVQKIKSDHEQQIRELVRDLQNGHRDEISELTKSHQAEMSQLQSVHESILSSLEKSHQSMLEKQVDDLRSEMSLSEASKLQALRDQLDHSHSLEMDELKCSVMEPRVDVTQVTLSLQERPESPSREQLKSQLKEELRVEFESEIQAKLQEQSEIIAKQVDEITSCIKSDAEKEQAMVAASHRQTVSECLAQHQRHLEALKTKFDNSVAEVQAKLRNLHQSEVQALEERHHRATEALRANILQELSKEHKRKTEELLEQVHVSHACELESAESRLVTAHKNEVDKLKSALEQQEASYVHLLEETRRVHGKELAEQADNHKRQLHDAVEQATHDLVKTLGEQMQAMLSEDIGCENWPPELRLLNEKLSSETHKELAEARSHHEAQIRHLRDKHQQELDLLRNANTKDDTYDDRNDWQIECKLLRTLVSELLQYLITIEEELNNFVDQSRMSDIESVTSEVSQAQESESGHPIKKVHFAPNIETVSGLLSETSLSEGSSTAVEDLRAELDRCLARVRREVADLLGMSEASLVGQKIPRDVELLKCKLLETERNKQLLEVELLETRERLADLDRKKREVVNEGYGEGIEDNPDLEKRLERLSEIQDRARSVLLSSDTDSPPHLLQLIEELSREGDLLAEEARKDKEDMQLQIEAADKQLKCTRQFLEEQAAEREQERDEFSRELGELQDTLKERERDRLECARQAKETAPVAAPPPPPCTSQVHQVADIESNIESLELQVKENVQQLQEAEVKTEELNANLKASSDKIAVLRDVIHNLEGQIEQKSASEDELKKRLTSLQLALDAESQRHSDLVDQLDLLRGEDSNAELSDHISVLEEQILAYTQQLEHLQQTSPAVREMKSQLRSMEASLDRRTKELERLHNASMSTCSSPSEDVSFREQLEANRAALCSPESESSSPLSLRRLQEKLQHHARAEEAAFKRIRDLEMQLNAVRHNEEEIHIERDALQQRVEEQLLLISSLQATLDQQRLQQSATEARDAAITRRQLQASAERLDQAKDLLQAKDTEICELRAQLEKTKKVIVSQEEDLSKKTRETEEEINQLRDQLEELQREKETLEISIEEARSTPRQNSRLVESLLAEKNAEIDELRLVVSSRLASDVSKEDFLDMMREVRRTSQGEVKSHCSTLQSSGRSEMEALRDARPESADFLLQQQASLTHNTSAIGDNSSLPPVPIPVLSPTREEAEAVQGSNTPLPAPQPDVSMLENQVATTMQQLADKQAEITELKSKLKESNEKLSEEIRRLREENSQLKVELNAVSGRLEEYAQLMQSEMEHSASLDQSLLQASSILLGNERESMDTSEQSDVSLRSENLQRLLSRVQKGGFEVLSLSELALLHTHTHSLLNSEKQTVATQTSRSGFSDAKQVAELQQQLSALEQTAASRDKRMATKVESLEAALSHEKQISHESAQNLDKEMQSLSEAHKTLEIQVAEIKQLRESNAELSALLAAEQQSTSESRNTQAVQVAEMQQLREKSEEVQNRVKYQEYNVQQLRLDLDKERTRAAALESSLAAEEMNTYKQRAHYEGECVRHQATMRRNAALTEMLDMKLTQAQQIENTLRLNLEQEQSVRRTLQEQVGALQRCRDTGNLDLLNQELKSNLEKEQELNTQLTLRLKEQQTVLATELQACEEREKRRAEIEINAEKELTQVVKHSLEQVQAQLQSTIAQVQVERENSTKLICHIQGLEEQLSNLKETLGNIKDCSERDKVEFERQKNALDVTLKHLYERKENAEKEALLLRQHLDAVTEKWEEQLTREKNKAEAMCDVNTQRVDTDELRQMRMRVQDLENKLIRAQAQGSQLGAEQRAWMSEKSSLLSQIMKLEHQTQLAKTMLATERTNWLLEKNKLLGDSSRCASPHSDASDYVMEGKLQYLFGKCKRTESYRKALVWQKRYLLVVLRGCQGREEILKEHILEVNGPKNAHLLTGSKKLSPLQRFKAAALVVTGVHRIQFITRAHLRACNLGSSVILKRMTDALLMSPEPRLEPPVSSFNGQSEVSSFSPPTRDTTRDDSYTRSSVSRSLLDSPPLRHLPVMNEFRLRCDMVQQRLGLAKQPDSKM